MPAILATTAAGRLARRARANGRRASSLPSPQEFARDLDPHRPAARNCSRHLTSKPSATSCSRHSSLIVFGPRNHASTISLFCCAVNLRYFLVSLNSNCSSLSGRSWTLRRTGRQPASRASPSQITTEERQRLRAVHARARAGRCSSPDKQTAPSAHRTRRGQRANKPTSRCSAPSCSRRNSSCSTEIIQGRGQTRRRPDQLSCQAAKAPRMLLTGPKIRPDVV